MGGHKHMLPKGHSAEDKAAEIKLSSSINDKLRKENGNKKMKTESDHRMRACEIRDRSGKQ